MKPEQLLTHQEEWVRQFGKLLLEYSFQIDSIEECSSGYFLKRNKWNYSISKGPIKAGQQFPKFWVFYSLNSLVVKDKLLDHIKFREFTSLKEAVFFMNLGDIREQFENALIDRDLLKSLYLGYCSISEIDLFLERAIQLFPMGNCGLTSLYLQYLFGGTIINGTYGGNPHTFLRLGDDIIDLTADQFGGPKIYIGPLIFPWGL